MNPAGTFSGSALGTALSLMWLAPFIILQTTAAKGKG